MTDRGFTDVFLLTQVLLLVTTRLSRPDWLLLSVLFTLDSFSHAPAHTQTNMPNTEASVPKTKQKKNKKPLEQVFPQAIVFVRIIGVDLYIPLFFV